jgi:hypothetical protein
VLLAMEAVLVTAALAGRMASNGAVLLLVANSILLIWCAARLRTWPSCCR